MSGFAWSSDGLTSVWTGDIDVTATRSGAARLLVATHTPHAVDLSGVSFMDSAGLALLLGLLRQATRAGGGLVVVSPSRPVRLLLELTGVEAMFDIQDRSGD